MTIYTKPDISGADVLANFVLEWNDPWGSAPPLANTVNLSEFTTQDWRSRQGDAGLVIPGTVTKPASFDSFSGSAYTLNLRSAEGTTITLVNDAAPGLPNRTAVMTMVTNNRDRLNYTLSEKSDLSTKGSTGAPNYTRTQNHSDSTKINWTYYGPQPVMPANATAAERAAEAAKDDVTLTANGSWSEKIVTKTLAGTTTTPVGGGTPITTPGGFQINYTEKGSVSLNLKSAAYQVGGIISTSETRQVNNSLIDQYEKGFDDSFTISRKVNNYNFRDEANNFGMSFTSGTLDASQKAPVLDYATNMLTPQDPKGTLKLQKLVVTLPEYKVEAPLFNLKLTRENLDRADQIMVYSDENLANVTSSYYTTLDPLLMQADNKITITSKAGAVVSGGGGKDRITGIEGEDTLDGGVGADWLSGGSGGDTYVLRQGFNGQGSGNDTIMDNDLNATTSKTSVDTLWLEYEHYYGGFDLTRQGANLLVTNDPTKSTVTVQDFTKDSGRIEQVTVVQMEGEFTDTWLLAASTTGGETNDWIAGTTGADKLDGKSGNDILQGGAGDDELLGAEGDDWLVSGFAGSIKGDTLNGGDGNDNYIVLQGAGVQTITDSSGWDTLELRGDFSRGLWDMTRTVDSKTGVQSLLITDTTNNRTITVNDPAVNINAIDKITLVNWRNSTTWDHETQTSVPNADLDSFVFSFNYVPGSWGSSDYDELLVGTNGSDTMSGFGGRDHIQGGGGNDFIFAHPNGRNHLFGNDGNDVIIASDDWSDSYYSGGSGNDFIDLTRVELISDSYYLEIDGGAGDDTVAVIDGSLGAHAFKNPFLPSSYEI